MSLSLEVKRALTNICTDTVFDEPMSRHTSFKIGGPADALAEPSKTEEIGEIISICKHYGIEYFIMGNGTNLLVSDAGFRGVVIKLQKHMAAIQIDGDKMTAGAGVLLSQIASAALRASLSGFERLGGIPGTLGGAVYMNAGAYGSEMRDVVVSSAFVDGAGNTGVISGGAHQFGYRKSVYSGSDKVIVSAVLQLAPGDAAEIKCTMAEYTKRRCDKQPLNLPSCGSTFKRPEGHFAGALIEAAGLKGYRIGGAQVSEKHAGFIVNAGGATAADVMRLVEHIKTEVYRTSGVTLECEMKTLGI